MREIILYKNFPVHGLIGLVLILIFWAINWVATGLRTHLAFFPLWLGYILFIDALVYKRKSSSLITRDLKRFCILFLISAPIWWIFELLNMFTGNWHYAGREFFTDFEYFILASISFSTVMPVVFESSELVSTFRFFKAKINGPVISPDSLTLRIFTAAGVTSLFLLLVLPEFFYPLLWLSLYFLIEPLNVKLKRDNLFQSTKNGNWQPVLTLFAGALLSGFLWEMWNYLSYPKWIYDLPYLNRWHIFEMPLPGYLGYLPFGLELFAFYNLIIKSNNNFLRINLQHRL
jgi:hypothetical protein